MTIFSTKTNLTYCITNSKKNPLKSTQIYHKKCDASDVYINIHAVENVQEGVNGTPLPGVLDLKNCSNGKQIAYTQWF